MAKNVIVVGVPRSGTSMTAGVFARKGHQVSLGEDDLVGADALNPMGYWESKQVIERNVEVLSSVGYEHHNTWAHDPITDEQILEIARLTPTPEHRHFVERFDDHAPWVWKDCRLCITLPYWWKLMRSYRTAVVLVQRDPDEVFQSFRRAGFTSQSEGSRERVFQIITQHDTAARRSIEALDVPHVEIDHRDFFERPESVAKRLGAFVDVELTPEDLHVRSDLNHSTFVGRVRTAIAAMYMKLPPRARAVVKSVVPEPIARAIATEKKYL